MTTEEALAVIEHPSDMGNKTWLLTVYAQAAREVASEVRRYHAMRCETCKHNDYGDCARTLHVERSDMGTKFESWTLCATLGGGCLAWEKKDA